MLELRTEDSFGTDQLRWIDMAKERKLRLPLWRMQCTTGGMRRWLRKIKRDPTWYLEKTNEKTLKVFAQNNPTWPLRAWAGICLEWVEEEEENDNKLLPDAN
jgi:hypothetical protein